MLKNLLVTLCLTLLVASYATASPQPAETAEPTETEAQRLVRSSGMIEREFHVLSTAFGSEAGALLLEALLDRDPTLRDEFAREYAEFFQQTLEADQLTALAEWFESPLGQTYSQALYTVFEGRDLAAVVAEPPADVSPDDPRRRLAEHLEAPWDIAESLAETLGEQRLARVLDFLDSPLGRDWMEASVALTQGVGSNFELGSPTRRMASLGCTIAIARPRIEEFFASLDATTKRTAKDLEPLLPDVFQAQETCDCLFGKLVEQFGPEVIQKVQKGDEAAAGHLAQLLVSGVCFPEGRGPSTPDGRMLETVQSVRNLGTAMVAWLTDYLTDPPPGSDTESPIPLAGGGWSIIPPGGGEPVFFAKVSADELEKILVPFYLEVLPRLDPWGHPLEYAVNTNLLANNTLGIRSAGRDGVFETEVYEVGTYAKDGSDHDVVWADGYFVRWPAKD